MAAEDNASGMQVRLGSGLLWALQELNYPGRLLRGVSGKESAPADAKDALSPAWVGKMPRRSK